MEQWNWREDSILAARAAQFARQLKATLRSLGLTYKDLATKLGVNEYTVRSWMRSSPRIPNNSHLKQLCDFLDGRRPGWGQALAAILNPFAEEGGPRPAPGARPPPDSPEPPNSPRTNLESEHTSFIGRAREIDAIRRLLAAPGLVTLWGPGGSGKTRLALQVAWAVLDEFRDGVWLVKLTDLTDPALVLQEAADVLEVPEQPGLSRAAALRSYLGTRRLLLVLDNCEHVLTGCQELIEQLVNPGPAKGGHRTVPCRHLTILATSREKLNIPEVTFPAAGQRGDHTRSPRLWKETTYEVTPLPLPAVTTYPARAPAVATLLDYEAIALFVARAQTAWAEFNLNLTPSNAAAVSEICQRLDGLPLAIELAAGWVRALPPPAMLEQLRRCLPLLRGQPDDFPARQQSLRATIDWSYTLLPAPEQTLFRRLAVFAGSVSLDAVQQVCVEPGQEVGEVLLSLAALVGKSLLQLEPAKDAPARYRMLRTIREYAEERLAASGEENPLRQRHVAYYLALAEQAAPELTGNQQGVWLQRLAAEHDNLRAVLQWAKEHGQGAVSLRLSAALWRFWYFRGYFSEGRAWLENAINSTVRGGSEALRATALKGMGNLAKEQGDYTDAQVYFNESLALFQALHDTQGVATLLNNLAVIAVEQSKFDVASRNLEESLRMQREAGNLQGVADALNNLGNVATHQGHYTEAEPFYRESLELREQLGDKRGSSATLTNLGFTAKQRGEYAAARSFYKRSLEIEQDLNDLWSEATDLINLAEIAWLEEDHDYAQILYERSLEMCEELGDKRGMALALCGLGHAALRQAEYNKASAQFAASLKLFIIQDNTLGLIACLIGLGGVARARAQFDCAARLFGAVESQLQASGIALDAADQREYEHHLAAARAQVAAAEFATAWQAGRIMSLKQAIRYALRRFSGAKDQ